jgi:hypothetical protein
MNLESLNMSKSHRDIYLWKFHGLNDHDDAFRVAAPSISLEPFPIPMWPVRLQNFPSKLPRDHTLQHISSKQHPAGREVIWRTWCKLFPKGLDHEAAI